MRVGAGGFQNESNEIFLSDTELVQKARAIAPIPGTSVTPEAIERLAQYVDGRMRSIAAQTRDVDSFRLAVLAALHIADASAQQRIAVAPIPDDGIGAAINDRLKRAAA